ncbi:MAG TPA: hypothetical protein VIF09_14760 [Polyangiaceae bacterium]
MQFRHSGVSFAVALAVPLAAGACAGSGADNEHGPDFTDGGGAGESGGEGAVGSDAAHDVTSHDGPASSDGGTEGAIVEGGADGAPDGPVDSPVSNDASEAGETGSTCTSSMAVLAAGSSSVAQSIYGHGIWSSATVVAGGASAAPSLVPFGTGYLGAVVGTGAASDMPLEGTAFTGSWSAPAHIGTTLGQGVPALAAAGTTAHVVYWGSDDKFYHGTYASSWDAANDPVQSGGGTQSFGPSAPAAAVVGSTLVMVQAGQDGVLYDQAWTGSWQAASGHAGTSLVSSLSPAIVALDGGTADLMVVFVHAGDAASYYLQYTTRTSGSWSSPADVYDQAGNVAYAGATPSLAALPGGGAALAWRGSSPAYPYVSLYTPGSGWSAPLAVSADALTSTPGVAAGVCGATMALAYVKTDGTIAFTSASGGPWSTPALLPGATSMTWVALATSP